MLTDYNTIVEICVFATDIEYEPYRECVTITYDFYESIVPYISNIDFKIPGFIYSNIYIDRHFLSDNLIANYRKTEDNYENDGCYLFKKIQSICSEHGLDLLENIRKAKDHINTILKRQDYYLNERNCYKRLEEEFKRYGKLIFCVDFDDTLYDYHKKGRTYENVIKLLKRWENYSEVIVFTGCGEEKYPMIKEYLDKHNIKYKGINCDSSIVVDGRKIYANVYIDDRGGLPLVYKQLLNLIEEIEAGELCYGYL